MEKFKQLLGSRKFWAALIGLALVIVKAWQPDSRWQRNNSQL